MVHFAPRVYNQVLLLKLPDQPILPRKSFMTRIRCSLVVSSLASVLWLSAVSQECQAEQHEKSQQDKTLFFEDFENGTQRWEFLDPATWKLEKRDGSGVLEITDRGSQYKPPVRSPGHVALVKDLELASFQITFRVKSTKDTGNHRDCCVFFNYIDDQHFYYVHLGAKPDPHSGQIMIVKEAPRLALTKNEKLTPWDDQWHDVKVVRNAKSGAIDIFFDDMTQPHMQINDKTFGKGRIGIGSFDDLNAFDDVRISAL